MVWVLLFNVYSIFLTVTSFFLINSFNLESAVIKELYAYCWFVITFPVGILVDSRFKCTCRAYAR